MGFVLLGLATANALGVSGAVLQMFSHGVIAALLFAVAGRMLYRRTHTRELDALSEMDLGRALPFAAFTFVIASAASMGIPGFSGFAAEITILIGAWKTYPIAVWITGAGMVLGSGIHVARAEEVFLRRDVSRHVTCSRARVYGRPIGTNRGHIAITARGKVGACLLMFATLAVGLYPKLLLDRILPAVEAMRCLEAMSYLELLRLASPEASCGPALVVLRLGCQRSGDVGQRVGCKPTDDPASGAAVSTGSVLVRCGNWPLSQWRQCSCCRTNATLFHGMLVITPLTSLFKIICLALAFFTVILARGERLCVITANISR